MAILRKMSNTPTNPQESPTKDAVNKIQPA
jgi:hypothetical protein